MGSHREVVDMAHDAYSEFEFRTTRQMEHFGWSIEYSTEINTDQ